MLNQDLRKLAMPCKYTAVIRRDGEGYIAYCPEVPRANRQGRTAEECRASLAEAIRLILKDRDESDGVQGEQS